MLPRTIKRLLPAAVLATAASWPANGLMAQEARPSLGKPQPERVVAEIGPELLEELRAMKRQMDELQRSDAAKAKQIEDLQRRLEQQSVVRQTNGSEPGPLFPCQQSGGQEQKQDPKSALDRAVRDLEQRNGSQQQSPLDRAVQGLPASGQPPIASVPVGGARFQLLDISVDGLFAVGTSTETEPSILELEGGDHDPHRRGFTVQNIELFLAGAVDPYLDCATNIVYKIDQEGETTVELEEAYMVTRQWPCGLQLKAGQYFTEFGRLNPQHPHSWQWIDSSIVVDRIFGADHMRGPGMRISKLLDCPWFSEVYVDVHNANGETQTSFFSSEEVFAERAPGGRPFVAQDVRDLGDLAYTVRWENGWTSGCDDEYNWLLGFSGSFGPNATGPDGQSQVYGTDLVMKWKPAKNERGWPFVIWESEFIFRHYKADNFSDLGDPIDPLDDVILGDATLQDWGFWSEVLYGCKPKYAVGMRYEWVSGSGSSLNGPPDFNRISRQDDPFRDDRHRISPMVAFFPTEFSRFRFQYNLDIAEHLGSDAHSFWVGMEWLVGAHAAHKF